MPYPPIANTSNTNTFQYWLDRTNECAYTLSNFALVTGANASGDCGVTGTFYAEKLTAGDSFTNAIINSTAIAIQNSSAAFVLPLPSASQSANDQFYLSSNGTWVLLSSLTSSVNTSGTGTQTIDYYAKATYDAAKYFVKVVDSANNHYCSSIHTVHDGNTAYITEYGQILSNSSPGVFSATSNTTSVILQFTPTQSSATVKFSRSQV